MDTEKWYMLAMQDMVRKNMKVIGKTTKCTVLAVTNSHLELSM
jgi:hypothetical protein